MEITFGDNKFYIGEVETSPLAEITFVRQPNNVIEVDHTFVSDELRGQKIAQKLVERVVGYAREQGLSIIPICPYAKKVMESTESYYDVLKK